MRNKERNVSEGVTIPTIGYDGKEYFAECRVFGKGKKKHTVWFTNEPRPPPGTRPADLPPGSFWGGTYRNEPHSDGTYRKVHHHTAGGKVVLTTYVYDKEMGFQPMDDQGSYTTAESKAAKSAKKTGKTWNRSKKSSHYQAHEALMTYKKDHPEIMALLERTLSELVAKSRRSTSRGTKSRTAKPAKSKKGSGATSKPAAMDHQNSVGRKKNRDKTTAGFVSTVRATSAPPAKSPSADSRDVSPNSADSPDVVFAGVVPPDDGKSPFDFMKKCPFQFVGESEPAKREAIKPRAAKRHKSGKADEECAVDEAEEPAPSRTRRPSRKRKSVRFADQAFVWE